MSRDDGALAGRLRAHLDRSSPERRGKVIAVLWCNAVAVVLVDGALAGCVALSAVRIWRRRDRGLVRATIDAGAWPSMAALVAASAVRRAVARAVVERVTQRGSEP